MDLTFEHYFAKEAERSARSRAASTLASTRRSEASERVRSAVVEALAEQDLPDVRADARLFLIENFESFGARPFADRPDILAEAEQGARGDVRLIVLEAQKEQATGLSPGTGDSVDRAGLIGTHALIAAMSRTWTDLWIASTSRWGPNFDESEGDGLSRA